MNENIDLKPKILHSSVPGDWDFRDFDTWDPADWQLNTVHFVSPPSSLTMWHSDGTKTVIAMCQLVQTQNLKQGRILTWYRQYNLSLMSLQFLLGITAPSTAEIIAESRDWPLQWKYHRCTWWYAYDYQNQLKTRVRLEDWDGSNWLQYSQNDYPPLSGDTNRIAIGYRSLLSRYSYIDETDIWVPS